jgi:hypothetical protein
MADEIERPRDLRINAWTGRSSPQEPLPLRTPWAQMENLAGRTQWLGAPLAVDERDWTHPDVGWGLVLPDNDSFPTTERAKADDAPEAIVRLLQSAPAGAALAKGLQQGYCAATTPMGRRRTYRRKRRIPVSVETASRDIC